MKSRSLALYPLRRLVTPNLNRAAQLMLEYYILGAGKQRAAGSGKPNPYASAIVPLAYSDELLMHGLTAMGSASLYCRQRGRPEIRTAVEKHFCAEGSERRREGVAACGYEYRIKVVCCFDHDGHV